VDAGLHRLQGKAERVTATLALLREFHAEKLAMLLRHRAAARVMRQYDVNNTYQYVINREETQLSWIASAIVESGGIVTDIEGEGATPVDEARAALTRDASQAQAFVARWQPRLASMTDARHRRVLDVVLGESLEHQRFFEQALAGRTDLLGKRGTAVPPASGDVLPDPQTPHR
jgi:hypothetical protein